jgi:hypothetical protein
MSEDTGTEMANIINMAKGLQQSANQAAAQTTSFMKYAKDGTWSHGADDIEPESDALWLIHPQSFEHGWIAWGDKAHGNHGEKLGEIKVAATEPLPLESSLDEVKGRWAQQVSMQMMCLTGMDKDTRVTFNTNSTGGRKAYQKIVNAVIEAITSGEKAVAPVVTLGGDWYKHKEFGKIYTPVMDIQEYKTLAEVNAIVDAMMGVAATPEKDKPKKAATKKVTAKAKAKVKTEDQVEDKPTRQKRTRRA